MELPPLTSGRLLRRYQRFLADVRLDDGREITAHCPNTGAMTGCAEPGSHVWLLDSANPKRKYRFTWELVGTVDGHLACVHSARANALAAEALTGGCIGELADCRLAGREVRYGVEGSRADLHLEGPGGALLVEVKSVTLHLGEGLGVFPDAPSARGRKHLRELAAEARAGRGAALLFVAQHTGIRRVAPADAIDPAYGEALREALAAGVQVLACGCAISPRGIAVERTLPVLTAQPGLPGAAGSST